MTACTARRAPAIRMQLIATSLSAVLAVMACSASHAAAPAIAKAATSSTARTASLEKTAVTIRNFAFEPATLTVAIGSKVVWINRDDEPHLVVSAGGQFPASPALDTDDRYATVFAKPGTYTYFCSIHPHMVGTIVVK